MPYQEGPMTQALHMKSGLQKLILEGIQYLLQVEHQARGGIGVQAVGVSIAGVPNYYCDLSQVRDEGLPKLSKKDLKRL